MAAQKSKYKPINSSKYKGDPTNIVCRSSWERKFCVWCDYTDTVLLWSSEEYVIPYISPLDSKTHRYFPDFYVKIRNANGKIEEWIVEVKPAAQTKEPKKQSRMTKRYINEVKTYAVNKYKWDYALEWCKDRNFKFVIFTERELGIKS
jgi:hypothetical protein